MTTFLEYLKKYWVQITAIVGLIGACFLFPFKLEAMDKRQDKFEEQQDSLYEQTTMIGKWVEQEQQNKEYEKERISSAPPGYRWDASRREYVKKWQSA